MARRHTKAETPKTASRRIALLVCNGDFPKNPGYQLPGPAKDAEHLARTLSDQDDCGFEVRSLVDGGLLDVRREVARVCADAGPKDTLLLYCSGRGFRDENGNFHFLVCDSENDFLAATALDAEFILSQLRRSACRKIVLLIDGCHAGAFFNNDRGIPDGLFAITACGADETCADTPDGGAFTLALIAGLQNARADRDGDGRVSIDELHEFVKGRLKAEGFEGTPQKWVWNVPDPIYVAHVPKHVFLSYAREDAAVAEKLEQALLAEGLAVWIDKDDIQSGSWKERVTEGLNRARAVVLLLTPNALASEAVRKELAFAARKKVPIIPVQPRILQEQEIPDWYTLDYDELHRHFIGSKNYPEGIRKLAEAIRVLGRQK
ncbi:MAG: TIR domain-containing protein [Desulfuromonadales bacterium]|nr:TIR domain-containing protein [Desulfuromonadales bacterium]